MSDLVAAVWPAGISTLARKISSLEALEIFFDSLLVDIVDWLELLRSTSKVVFKWMRRPAYPRGPTVRSFGLLDRARCYPIPILKRS